MQRLRNVVVILDGSGELIIIKLSKEQMEESETYDYFEDYLYTLEEEYDFSVNNSDWQFMEELNYRVHGVADYYEEPLATLF